MHAPPDRCMARESRSMERSRDQAGDDDDDLVKRLPDDVTANVLRRLAPRWLAVSRCVCKAWRAVVDTRGLLRAVLLPLSLAGIFIDFQWFPFSEFFSRPTSTTVATPTEISGRVDFLPLPPNLSKQIECYYDEFVVRDHCNGLLVVSDYVVNPATRRWDSLPDPPPDNHYNEIAFFYDEYLVFDPAVSPHYEVIMVPRLHYSPNPDPLLEQSEWPPSPCVLRVFSSRSGRWEERSFVRQGNAAGTVTESRCSYSRLFSAYWRGSLYVHCQDFIMRITLSEDKYRVIKPPVSMQGFFYLGRSEKGVYVASLHENDLHVWILNESCDGDRETEWMLKGKYSLDPVRALDWQDYGPWILQDNNSNFYRDLLPNTTNRKAPPEEERFEWNSDSDDDDFNPDTTATPLAEASSDHHHEFIDIELLGFHPYKEIMFMSRSKDYKRMAIGLAYHLNSSKVEALGSIYPTHYGHFDSGLVNENRSISYSFLYTPCWVGDLS